MPDLKITQLTDLPIPAVGDELPIAADPLGTPVTKKTKVGNLTRQILDPTAKTANYTLTTSDRFITVDASGANRTVFVPAASGNEGIVWTVKKIDSSTNTVTIDPSGSETIDGAATFVLTEQNQAISFTSNGTNLVILFNKQDNTGGSPGGSSGQVQFNNAGTFGADSALSWDNADKRLTVGPSVGTPGTEQIRINRGGRGAGSPVFRIVEGVAGGDRFVIDGEGNCYSVGLITFNSIGGFSGIVNIGGSPRRIQNVNNGESLNIHGLGLPVIHTASSASVTPTVIRGAASQTANLQEWQDSSNTVYGYVSPKGNKACFGRYAGIGVVTPSDQSSWMAIGTNSVDGDRAGFYLSHQTPGSGYGFFFFQDGNVYQDNYGNGANIFRSGSLYKEIFRLSQEGNISTAFSTTAIGLVVRGAASQTANLQEWQNSAGTVLASVSAAGNGTFVNLTSIPQQAGLAANDISLFTTQFRQTPNGIDLRISDPTFSFNEKVFAYSFGRIGYGTGNLSGGLLNAKMEFRGTVLFIDALNENAVRFAENDSSNNNFLSLYHDSSTADTDRFYIHTAKIANASFRPHLELGGRTFSLRTGLNGNVPTSNAITFSVSETGAAIFQPSTASTVPLSVRGAASQTANLQEWQNSASTTVAGITNNGDLFLYNISGSNTTARLGHSSGNSSVFSGWLNNTTQTIGIGFNVVGQYGGGTTGTNGRNLFVYDYVSGAYRFGIGPAGDFYYGNSNTSFSVRMLPSAASNVPLAVRAAVSQTADLQQWQNSAGTALASVGAGGNGYFTAPFTINHGLFAGAGLEIITVNGPSDSQTAIRHRQATGNYGTVFDQYGNCIFYQNARFVSTGGMGPEFWYGNASAGSGNENHLRIIPTSTTAADATIDYLALRYAGSNYPRMRWSATGYTFNSGGGSGWPSGNGAPYGTATLTETGAGDWMFTALTSSTTPLSVRGAASQTANLQEWQNSAGTVLAFISAGGTVTTRAASASSYNAFEFRDSGGVARAWVDVTGQTGTLVISDVFNVRYSGVGTPPSSAAQAQIVTDSASRRALIVRGATSQTADLQQWQDSAGNVLAEVTPTGKHTIYQTALNNTEGISLNRRSDGAPVMRMYLNSGSEVAIDSFGALNYGTGTVRYAGAAQFSGTLGIVGALSTMTFNTGSSFAIFTSGATTVTPIVVRAAASQTANLTEWQDSAGTVLAFVNAAGDIEITDAAKGIILKSPDNTRWRITIDNSGALTTTSL